jgi:hypothetical protein
LHLTGCARACTISRGVGENGGWMQNWNYFVLGNLCFGMWSLEVQKNLHIVFYKCTPYMWACRLKPSHVGKLVVHRYDSWKCREFLCIIHKNLAPYVQGDIYQGLGCWRLLYLSTKMHGVISQETIICSRMAHLVIHIPVHFLCLYSSFPVPLVSPIPSCFGLTKNLRY